VNRKLNTIISTDKYSIDKTGIMHFVEDSNRPSSSVNLGMDTRINDSNLYSQNAEYEESSYQNNKHNKALVDHVSSCKGIIVDLATGPGGGHIAPILKRLNPQGLLIATDACIPVVINQYKFFKPIYGDKFEMIDLDLRNDFPFKDNSIDIFTGVEITNIQSGIENTLKEVSRCLKSGGELILSQRFYSPNSATAKYLAESNDIFSVIDSIETFSNSIGLYISKIVELFRNKGKTDPRDGFPIDDTDEWSVNHIYFVKK